MRSRLRAREKRPLRRADEAGDLYIRVNALACLGLVAAHEGDVEDAVVLLSQATAESRDFGLVLDFAAEVTVELENRRAQLGDERFEAARACGIAANAGPAAVE